MPANQLILERFAYTPTETQGRLIGRKRQYATIERPWIQGPYPGGMSFESCIPDGEYDLVPHTRPTGEQVVALVNPDLGVWYQSYDRPEEWGRYLILIHVANFVNDVVGCIGPGLFRTIYLNRVMVTSSRIAMRQLDVTKYKSILIEPSDGAYDREVWA